ncbi:hypothetical protein ACJJTC_014187 [Scirpophaga incertulas]
MGEAGRAPADGARSSPAGPPHRRCSPNRPWTPMGHGPPVHWQAAGGRPPESSKAGPPPSECQPNLHLFHRQVGMAPLSIGRRPGQAPESPRRATPPPAKGVPTSPPCGMWHGPPSRQRPGQAPAMEPRPAGPLRPGVALIEKSVPTLTLLGWGDAPGWVPCSALLINDIQGRKHYETEHPGEEYVRLKRYMCDICGHITKQYANLMAHMRTHTNEKPFECPLCDRRFSMPSNRDRHLVVHTGEKRFECQHCNRRFTQSSALKLHIQTVHLKIPYAPWDKKNRKRRKLAEGTVAPAATTATCVPQVSQKILIDNQGDYLNAYITYNV